MFWIMKKCNLSYKICKFMGWHLWTYNGDVFSFLEDTSNRDLWNTFHTRTCEICGVEACEGRRIDRTNPPKLSFLSYPKLLSCREEIVRQIIIL